MGRRVWGWALCPVHTSLYQIYDNPSIKASTTKCSRRRQTLLPVPPPGELNDTYVSSLILTYSLHHMKTWRLPQDRKYIAVRRGQSHDHGNTYRKFGEIWTCGFWDTQAHRQTKRQTDRWTRWSQYFVSLQEGGVTTLHNLLWNVCATQLNKYTLVKYWWNTVAVHSRLETVTSSYICSPSSLFVVNCRHSRVIVVA